MTRVPLAEQMRPITLDEVVGQEHLLDANGILRHIVTDQLPTNIILWGPPGTGKTTLARIVAHEMHVEFIELSAVTSGKKDIDRIIEHARQNWNLGLKTILFVDEIHRFNKAQQDAFLPHVESGLITLIGATTENPSFEVINPLLSRSRVLTLKPLSKDDIKSILRHTLKKLHQTRDVTAPAIDLLANLADGDARAALGNLELALSIDSKVTPETISKIITRTPPRYDKNGDAHYDILSAFIKSLRGSDVRASTYYLARMLQAGEDPKLIARRLIVFASEDIGLAGNGAVSLAVAAFDAVERVGLPEARYNLFHCTVALARSKKSREISDIMHDASDLAQRYPNSPIPLSVRNAPTKLMADLGYNAGYKWQSDFRPDGGFLPDDIKE